MFATSHPGCPDVRSGADIPAAVPWPPTVLPTVPWLSPADHGRLRACLDALPPRDPIRAALQAKLRDAALLPADEVDDDVARIGSRVVYRLRGARVAHRRTLVLPGTTPPRGWWLSVLSPVGLALLGSRAGQEIACPSPSGAPIAILLKRVEGGPPGAGD